MIRERDRTEEDLGFIIQDESFEGIERLRDDLRRINERWNNRFIPEHADLAKAYVHGDFAIVLICKAGWSIVDADQRDRFVCVVLDPCARQRVANLGNFDVGDDLCHRDGGQDEVVLVVVVRPADAPERRIPVKARFYLIEDELLNVGVGEGLLYRVERRSGGLYKVFPFFAEREVNSFAATNDLRGRVIKGGSKVVYRISDNERDSLGDRFEWLVSKLRKLRVVVNPVHVSTEPPESEHALVERGRPSYDFIDVAIGPLDL